MDPAAAHGEDHSHAQLRIYKHTSEQRESPVKERLVSTIVSMDKLSKDFLELPVDRILTIGDQRILVELYSKHHLKDCFLCPCKPNYVEEMHGLVDQLSSIEPLDEPDSIGGPVNNFYSILNGLKTKEPHEILLYMSGHGLHPGNIGLIPDSIFAHPSHFNLDDPSSEAKNQQKGYTGYMKGFYDACKKSEICESSNGFVGGEVAIHQRGYIGVLGVLGLWCYYNRGAKNNQHLVIVADCCYSGIWGETLKKFVDSKSMVNEYRQVLSRSPISIQCATDEFEESYAGFFTPLWYLINTEADITPESSDEYKNSDISVSQTPFYVSTSQARPSWKMFDDPQRFHSLHKKVLDAILSATSSSTLRTPYCIAHEALGENYKSLHSTEERKLAVAQRGSDTSAHFLSDIAKNKTDAYNAFDFYNRQLHEVYRDLFKIYMPRRGSLLPEVGLEGRLNGMLSSTVKKKIAPAAHQDIPAGVYVFPGGVGDMSLIVTQEQDEVILIDGTKSTKTFKSAWDSRLKHLKRITSIYVTHHDEDHTFGIELLLTRYLLELEDCPYLENSHLPQLKGATIYMNTRSDFLAFKGLNNENNLIKLATKLKKANFNATEKLGVQICPVTVQEIPRIEPQARKLTIITVLPNVPLVQDVARQLDDETTLTEQVKGKGKTTATNVLSIALVAVWNKTDAFFFTGDAHLTDVTNAAKRFLEIYPEIKSFKYVDVPHHGSKHSNRTDVSEEERGLACIPAEKYLISHDGCNSTPHPDTIADILKRRGDFELHFLYPERRKAMAKACTTCGTEEKSWHSCVKENGKCVGRELNHVIDKKLCDGGFKFFELL